VVLDAADRYERETQGFVETWSVASNLKTRETPGGRPFAAFAATAIAPVAWNRCPSATSLHQLDGKDCPTLEIGRQQ
jgi:hypothetical protein